MATFDIVNRSPDGSTYFSEMGMNGWLYCPIVEMASRGFNGSFVEMDYLTMQMSAVPGFPQLFFRVYGNFNFVTGNVSSGGTGLFVQAGSIINQIDVIDASGHIYNTLTGINFAINTNKTTTTIEPLNVFANSFRPGENPDMAVIMAGNDYVSGNSGAEFLYGYAGHDTLIGEGGSDQLAGGFGNDLLVGGDGADDLYGEAGNDTIVGYTAGDYINGGADFDTWALTGTYASGFGLLPQHNYTGVSFYDIEAIRVTWGEMVLNSNQVGGTSTVQTIIAGSSDRDALRVVLAPGSSTINLSGVNFVNWNNWSGEFDLLIIVGSTGNDTIDGSQVNDNIFGSGGADVIRGLGGNDNIAGADGHDNLRGGNGADSINGWGGNDVIIGDDDFAGGGDDSVSGGSGNDIIRTGRGFNFAHGGDGIDTIDYQFSIDNVIDGVAYEIGVFIDLSTIIDPTGATGRASTYIVIYTPEVTTPVAFDFLTSIENVNGSAYGDVIIGNFADNVLNGGDGNDTLSGLAGNDTLNGGTGNDSMIGGTGNDWYFVDSAGDIIVEAAGGGTADRVLASVSFALAADDNIEQLTTMLQAGLTAINLTGNGLAQAITSNAGINVLNGGGGNDTMSGLGGADTFVFSTSLGTGNVDTITDFNVAEDTIHLDDAIFAGLTTGMLGGAAFAANLTGAATDALDRIIYETDTGRVYFDADGNGAIASVHFATLTANLAVTNADFFAF